MKQHDFIWVAKNVGVENATQDEIGNTIITLRPQIQLTHNYKKKNQMLIIFLEDQARFIIPTRKELETIYTFHLMNTNLTQILRDYCEKTLRKYNS